MSINEAEFRGTDNLWIAEVIKDDSAGYTFGEMVDLAPTAQISKSTNSSSETHYYSNVGMITIVTNGGDTVTVVTPVLALRKLAMLTGQEFDESTGTIVTGELKEKYFALIYRTQLTDNTWRYTVKFKAMLTQPPEEVSQTRDDGVNTNNQQIVFTCQKTVYEFTNGGHADGIELDERDNLCDFSTFFSTVYTPDTVYSLAKVPATALSITPTTSSITVGNTVSVTATVTPTDANVVFTSSNPNVASISASGKVCSILGVSAGTAIITAVSGSYSASCAVTVQDE